MLADIDLDLNDRWVSGPGTKDAVRLVQFKRDTSSELRVRFWSEGRQVELPDDAAGTFGIKKKSEYDSTALVLAESWIKTGDGATTVYTFTPEFDGVALAALFGVGDGDISNDQDYVLGMCEIKWIADGKKHRTQTVDALVDHEVLYDGDGGAPSSSRLWSAHLALTDVPIDSDYSSSVLDLIFAGANNNLSFAQIDGGDRIFIRIYEPEGISVPPPLAQWDADIRTLQVSITPGVTTANALVAAIEMATTTEFTVTASEGDGSGFVEAVELTGFTGGTEGTAATALDQAAIVSHSDNTFTEWACVRRSPVAWLPRTAGIIRNRVANQWERLFIGDPAETGFSSIQTEILPDQ